MTNVRIEFRGNKETHETSPGRLELPTSRLTVGRANQLRHGDLLWQKLEDEYLHVSLQGNALYTVHLTTHRT
ncbi:hypothetical protein N7535_003580 [Penicillium sp. DV-2018c]|nr:hypothetical protein N7461_000719 [Penicillium sp. DV-2018c]KAJ5576654.1 hypothetical protein N7535_003580 [Penicillium sp. DV-2018c]